MFHEIFMEFVIGKANLVPICYDMTILRKLRLFFSFFLCFVKKKKKKKKDHIYQFLKKFA